MPSSAPRRETTRVAAQLSGTLAIASRWHSSSTASRNSARFTPIRGASAAVALKPRGRTGFARSLAIGPHPDGAA